MVDTTRTGRGKLSPKAAKGKTNKQQQEIKTTNT
jgi:hypothetical protein